MNSSGQKRREVRTLDSACLQRVEVQRLFLQRIVEISVKDLGSGEIASLGKVNVEIFVLGIGEDGGEILVRSASAQLNLFQGLLRFFESDGRKRSVSLL